MTKLRVSKPRRHHLVLNRFGDGRRPRPRLLVGHQGHGRDFARAVTALAVVLQDGDDVFVESWFLLFFWGGRRAEHQHG